VIAPHTEYARTRNALTGAYPELAFEIDEIQFVPKGETVLNDDESEQFEKLLDLLNACEDVQNIYHDVK